MKSRVTLPSRVILCEMFFYDTSTGKAIWKSRTRNHFSDDRSWKRFNTMTAGNQAGTPEYKNGKLKRLMIKFRIQGILHKVPLTVVIMGMNGVEVPTHLLVDHRDRNPENNRWDNLR